MLLTWLCGKKTCPSSQFAWNGITSSIQPTSACILKPSRHAVQSRCLGPITWMVTVRRSVSHLCNPVFPCTLNSSRHYAITPCWTHYRDMSLGEMADSMAYSYCNTFRFRFFYHSNLPSINSKQLQYNTTWPSVVGFKAL